MLTIASANLNGIRAARRRGMMAWLETRALDVLTLQEVRASDQVLREQLGPGWHVAHSEPTLAGHKGRAGVAVASRQPIAEVRSHLGDRFAGTGRWVEADIALLAGSAAAAVPAPGPSLLTVVSAYVHSGEAGAPRQDDKYAFLGAPDPAAVTASAPRRRPRRRSGRRLPGHRGSQRPAQPRRAPGRSARGTGRTPAR